MACMAFYPLGCSRVSVAKGGFDEIEVFAKTHVLTENEKEGEPARRPILLQ
jgi:hypothetical protein